MQFPVPSGPGHRTSSLLRCGYGLAMPFLAMRVALAGGEEPAIPRKPDAAEVRRPAEFAQGVTIDWANHTVQVEGAVVLRQGDLELFACSARTREHESIMVIKGRPLHVYQAMGLCGLAPGSPMKYDEKENRRIPPTGQALELRVRYREDEFEYTVPLEHWMVEVQAGRSPQALPWVFAGSRTSSEGRFGADVEGTIVAVVDFDTAIIGLGALHTADNAALWLAAKTAAIPPNGTRCVLSVRQKPSRERERLVSLGADGVLRQAGTACTESELFKSMARDSAAPDRTILVVQVEKNVPISVTVTAREALLKVGIERESLEFRPPDPQSSPARPKPEG